MDQLLTLSNSHGYIFEFGNASYETSLEERIQAAKILTQQQNEKKMLINSK